MKKKICVIFASIVILILFLVSCQPTPVTEIVNNKNDQSVRVPTNTVEKKEMTETPQSYKSSTSNRLSGQNKTSKGGVLNIDAKIIEPQIGDFNIVKLQATTFTDEEVKNVVEYFSKGEPLYNSLSQGYWTKERIETIIIDLKEQINAIKGNNDPHDAFRIGDLEGSIEELEAMYQDAPYLQEWKKEHLVSGIAEVDTTRSEYILQPENKKLSFININSIFDSNNPMPTIEYYNRDTTDHGSAFSRNTGKHPLGITMSSNEVRVFIENMLDDLKIDHMGIDSITVAKDITEKDTALFESGETRLIADVDVDDGATRYYSVYLTRKHKGIISPYVSEYAFNDNSVAADGQPVNYRSIWGPEYIRVDINDTGILYFLWSCPTKIIEEEPYSENIIDIDTATDLFFKNASLLYADQDSEALLLKISRVELGYYYEPIKDNLDEYLMIPSWYFFGINENKMFLEDYFSDFARAHTIINATNGELM